MSFLKRLFGSSKTDLNVPDNLKLLAEEMKERAMVMFNEEKEPQAEDIKLYDGRIAIQCEYEIIYWQDYKNNTDKPDHLHVSISFPNNNPSEQDVNLITLAFFGRIDGVRIQTGASVGVDVIHLKGRAHL